MQRHPVTALIGVALAVYGLYIASFVPGLLSGPMNLILVGFVLQAVSALGAAVGVFTGAAWAPGMVILLGAAVAITEVAEGFVVGIIAYNRALGVALLGILVTFGTAVYVKRSQPT